ncbi:ABC transporter substrate-binding protein [Collinsella tanakaei]|uniref:peptide ABC transporter substrate-binding protein n=1 Tax=Collinsella tanakaei TaxID=626935 RepID=UPI001957011F|nr:ABC transporter substrate-binding protein [Collinsella tanakaei]MBM6756479.1 ABC transporter substrate-binding protein [Collinsella tanakaei]
MAEFLNKPVGRRTFVGGALATGVLAALAGCGQKGGNTTATGSGEGGSATGGTLRYYINNPVCIEPFNLQEDQGTQVGFQLFDSLTQYNFEEGKLEPLACESYEVNDDATEFTFHLKPAKFHDGTDVTSANWKYGWERIVNPNTNTESPSVIGYHLAMIDGYDALAAGEAEEMTGLSCPDDETFVVKLSYSYADFPYVASHPALAPIPDCAKDMTQTEFGLAPVGNGPFKMDGEWVDGQYINLVRFDDYYGDKAVLDGVNFMIQKDVETAYKEFQAGNLDVSDVPVASLETAAKEYGTSEDGYTITPGHQFLNGTEPSTYYLTCNVVNGPFTDVNLRHAVSLAINRQAICDTLFHGSRTPADNIVPPGIDGYEEGAWEYSRYDVDAAKEILDQYYPADADGNRGLELTITSNQDGGHKEVMDSIISDLAAVGITCVADTPDWATVLDRYQKLDYQFGRLGWVADYPILDNFLYPLFYTGNGDNRAGYSNPEVDEALMAARSTVDDDERKAALQAVNKTIGEDMPVIPIMFYTHTMVGGPNVATLYLDPQKKADLSKAELVSA